MAHPLLQIDTLTKSFGDLLLFRDISFGIAEGDKIGLLAPNGSGKTTLLNIIAGKEGYDAGRVVFRNDIRFAYLDQSPAYDPELPDVEIAVSEEEVEEINLDEVDDLLDTLYLAGDYDEYDPGGDTSGGEADVPDNWY